MSTNFFKNVYKAVRTIPFGKVASYGQVARWLGAPKAARQVGWALRNCPSDVPWWRVVNNSGRVSIKNPKVAPIEQSERLENEGVHVEKDFSLDIGKYRYVPSGEELLGIELPDDAVYSKFF